MSMTEKNNEMVASILRDGCWSFFSNRTNDTKQPCMAANKNIIVHVSKLGFCMRKSVKSIPK